MIALNEIVKTAYFQEFEMIILQVQPAKRIKIICLGTHSLSQRKGVGRHINTWGRHGTSISKGRCAARRGMLRSQPIIPMPCPRIKENFLENVIDESPEVKTWSFGAADSMVATENVKRGTSSKSNSGDKLASKLALARQGSTRIEFG